MPSPWAALAAAVAAALLAGPGCTTPTAAGYAFAQARDFEPAIVAGLGFRHVVWRKAGRGSADVIHVYIEGDGTPYRYPDRVASDPTPRRPLMLHLMALDPYPSVYVGRPCYWGLHADRGCTPYSWSLGRFAGPVVDSMVAVINSEEHKEQRRHIVLYAHSGGAALALLAVGRGLQVDGIVTVGANLDPDAWAALHGFARLTGSLNPTAMSPLTSPPPMRHYVGDADRTTPVGLVRTAASKTGGEVVIVSGFDHQCCWERIWPIAVEFPQHPAN